MNKIKLSEVREFSNINGRYELNVGKEWIEKEIEKAKRDAVMAYDDAIEANIMVVDADTKMFFIGKINNYYTTKRKRALEKYGILEIKDKKEVETITIGNNKYDKKEVEEALKNVKSI